MENALVHRFTKIFLVLCLLAGWAGQVSQAMQFHLTDNQTLTGEIVSMDEKGVVLKLSDGSYGDKIPWGKLSQADLKEMQENPKAAPFVEPFIIPVQQDRAKRTEVDIKEFPKLTRPAKQPLVAALFTSAIGIFIVLLIYAANLYAAHEIAIYRNRKPALVCGVAAVLPVIGPIIFLAMPSQVRKKEEAWHAAPEQHLEPAIQEAIAADVAAEAAAKAATVAAEPVAPVINLPPTKTYSRGQYTFNRRFIETQLAPFCAMNRPDAEKEMGLTIKAARGTFVAQRISKVAPADMTLQVHKGEAFEDVTMPYLEIQEIQIKHKDAK